VLFIVGRRNWRIEFGGHIRRLRRSLRKQRAGEDQEA